MPCKNVLENDLQVCKILTECSVLLKQSYGPSGRLICEFCWHFRWSYRNLWNFDALPWGHLANQYWEWENHKKDWRKRSFSYLGLLSLGRRVTCFQTAHGQLEKYSRPRCDLKRKWLGNITEWCNWHLMSLWVLRKDKICMQPLLCANRRVSWFLYYFDICWQLCLVLSAPVRITRREVTYSISRCEAALELWCDPD